MIAVLSFAISVVLGGFLGWLTARFDKKERALGGILGLVVVCLGGLVAIFFEMYQFKEDQTNALSHAVPILKSEVWRAVVKEIATYDQQEPGGGFTEVLEDPVRRNIEMSLIQATNGTIDVEEKSDVVRITSELLHKAHGSIEATSFVDPKDWWKSSIGDNYFADMRDTKKHVPKFTRIFILGSTNEAKLISAILQGQRSIGIDVRYVCAVNIPAKMRRDFIVIDDTVAAELTLDEDRHFKHATFYSTRHNAGSFSQDFQDLSYNAKPYDGQAGVTCPTLPMGEQKKIGDEGLGNRLGSAP